VKGQGHRERKCKNVFFRANAVVDRFTSNQDQNYHGRILNIS